jgi:hypothetical protein
VGGGVSQDVSGAGAALQQVREVIAILRELANAGPRDSSFKQWRQVTLTLLQRIWPGDQTRAVRFRRIPFSPPSSRADAKTVRDCYVRGVNEALSYLESLALELEPSRRPMVRPQEAPVRAEPESEPPSGRRPLVRPPEAPLRAELELERPPEPVRESSHERFMPRPAPASDGPIEPSPGEAQGPSGPAAAAGAGSIPATPAPAAPPAAITPAPTPAEPPAAPATAGPAARGPRTRLKDMLGFGDEAQAPVDEVEAQMPGARPRQPAPPAAAPVPAPLTAAAPVPAPPAAASPPPTAAREERPVAPVRPAPAAPAPAREPEAAPPERAVRATAPPAATLREMLDRQITPPPAPPMRASREVRGMAAAVDQLGVPRERQEIVRAALLDLGQQMDAPPIQWAALRQAMTFLMEYPQIARRVIPMLLPYLDEAA